MYLTFVLFLYRHAKFCSVLYNSVSYVSGVSSCDRVCGCVPEAGVCVYGNWGHVHSVRSVYKVGKVQCRKYQYSVWSKTYKIHYLDSVQNGKNVGNTQYQVSVHNRKSTIYII